MGDVVNLNDRRKQKARKTRVAEAAENRIRFGRTKAERDREDAERSAEVRKLDGAKREPDDKTPTGG